MKVSILDILALFGDSADFRESVAVREFVVLSGICELRNQHFGINHKNIKEN